MTTRLFRWIDKFAGLKTLVLGEAMLDRYLVGTTNRLCPEAPVPIVAVDDRQTAGAANSAANVAALGGQVHFLSVTGDDVEGKLLRRALNARGVSTENVLVQRGRRTLSKNRVIAGEHMLVRYDDGDTAPLDALTEQKLINCLVELFPRCDAVLISDYAYGVLTAGVIETLERLQARHSHAVIVDAKNLCQYCEVGVTAVKPNYREAVQLLGIRELAGMAERAEQMVEYGDQLLDLTGARLVALTLDSDGALVFERGQPPYRTYAHPTPHSRAAGAGDTFISALTLALGAGAEPPVAAELASAAAAVVVQKEGTATCSMQELRGHVASGDKPIADLTGLVARLDLYREQGKQIVFTNGCFDILHRGHIAFLNQAKELGNVLIVGLNADGSVRRLKGPERPINSLQDRMQVLEALSCVDHIVPFEEDTPLNLLQLVRPDIYVKGGDYTREQLPEARVVQALGGRVEILPYLAGHSTTNIIRRVRRFPQGNEREAAKPSVSSGNGHEHAPSNGNGHGNGKRSPLVPASAFKIAYPRKGQY